MLKKLMSIFKSDTPDKKPTQPSKTKTSSSKSKPKVQPTRIGELGEHKINIQLEQLPKRCKYVSPTTKRSGIYLSFHSRSVADLAWTQN